MFNEIFNELYEKALEFLNKADQTITVGIVITILVIIGYFISKNHDTSHLKEHNDDAEAFINSVKTRCFELLEKSKQSNSIVKTKTEDILKVCNKIIKSFESSDAIVVKHGIIFDGQLSNLERIIDFSIKILNNSEDIRKHEKEFEKIEFILNNIYNEFDGLCSEMVHSGGLEVKN